MRRIVTFVFLISFLMVQNGCSIKQSSDKESYLDGIVMSENEGSLMIAFSGKEGILSPFEPASVFYKAVKESFPRGTLIRITFDGTVRESYPVQVTAKDIAVIQEVKDNWPPTMQIDSTYSPEEAIADGCYVENINGKNNNKNLEVAVRFWQNASQGICAYLRKVTYTTEGDPIIADIIYDGTKFYAVTDSTRDSFLGTGSRISSKEYSFLNTYEKDGKKIIYLANKEQVSQEEYESESLDTFTVYLE